MYSPSFTLTHQIVQQLIKIELCVRDIKTIPIPVKTQGELFIRFGTQNMIAMGELTDLRVSEESATNLHTGKELPPPGSTIMLLSNYRSTRDFIYASIHDPYMPFSAPLFLHINKLLGNTVYESWEIGRFRSPTDTPEDIHDTWLDHVNPNDNPDFHKYYSDVLQWYSSRSTQTHSALKLGCVIFELLSTYPFLTGNLPTIIAITELLISRTHLSLRGLFPVATMFHAHQTELLTQLKNSNPSSKKVVSGKAVDMTNWCEVFIKSWAVQLTSLKNEIVKTTDRKSFVGRKKMMQFTPRQQKLLRFLAYHGRISRRQYVNMTGISAMTAFRDIQDLLRKKIIVARGGGRSTMYILPEEAANKLENAKPLTPKVVRVINDSAEPEDPYQSSGVFSEF